MGLVSCATTVPEAEEFTVMVYNVENLFDVDGVALFSDYKQGEDTFNPEPYGPRKLLTKLQNVVQVLKAMEGGEGPAVILFNEFEYDRTPGDLPFAYDRFLEQYRDTTVEAMLTESFDAAVADLPVDALLLKQIIDAGLPGYDVVLQAPRPIDDSVPAHTNAVFTRYPILDTRTHTAPFGRDVLEVMIEVAGHPVTLFCNHWKSGASRAEVEPQRIPTAEILRERVEAILENDPLADIIIGGDLNSHYNQSAVLGIESGVNDILLSQGDELRIREADEDVLYNLWYEVPPDERRSELYQGRWGTLMQILLTRGAYHRSGVSYIDQSFGNIILPGVNAGEILNRPISWTFAGETGGGFSDHFPVYARFRVDPTQEGYINLSNPSREGTLTAYQPSVDYDDLIGGEGPLDVAALSGLSTGERARAYYGSIFEVRGNLTSVEPLLVSFDGGESVFGLWSPDFETFEVLRQKEPGTAVHFLGEFSEHRGYQQFRILKPSWLLDID